MPSSVVLCAIRSPLKPSPPEPHCLARQAGWPANSQDLPVLPLNIGVTGTWLAFYTGARA